MYISPYHGSETGQEDGKRWDFSLGPPPLRKIIVARDWIETHCRRGGGIPGRKTTMVCFARLLCVLLVLLIGNFYSNSIELASLENTNIDNNSNHLIILTIT